MKKIAKLSLVALFGLASSLCAGTAFGEENPQVNPKPSPQAGPQVAPQGGPQAGPGAGVQGPGIQAKRGGFVGVQVDMRNDGTMVAHDGKGGAYTYKRDGTGTATYTDANGVTSKLETDADGNTVIVGEDGKKTIIAPNSDTTLQKSLASAMKDLLDVSDDEWKALEPKIIKVNKLTQELVRGTRTGGVTIPGTGMMVGGTPSELLQANLDLKKLVEDKNASDESIKAGIVKVHEAKSKTAANLAAAKKDLNASLTPRQQAAMLGGGRGEDRD